MDQTQMRQTKTSGKSLLLRITSHFIMILLYREIFFSSYLPFGGGPRKCIGDMFASFEVKNQLTSILVTYEFLLQKFL